MDHVGSKTRSLGQILEKKCSRDQIFGLILMKLGQSICLDEITEISQNGASYTDAFGEVKLKLEAYFYNSFSFLSFLSFSNIQ